MRAKEVLIFIILTGLERKVGFLIFREKERIQVIYD